VSSPDFLAAAQSYAARGWRIVPVHVPTATGCSCARPACASPGKHPTIAKWTERTFPPEAWSNGAAKNLGIVTGAISGLVVVDVDGGGEETLAQLERELGALPTTVAARTGSGGRHLLFRHPGGLVRNDAKKRLGPGLDVRGDGGFIVAAPSLHKSGARYAWLAGTGPEDRDVALLPAGWLERLREPPRREIPDAPAASRTSGDVQRRASAYLARIPGAVSGAGGHGQAFDAAIKVVRGFALDQEAAFALLWSEYNPRCDPPWSEKELRHKIRQAIEVATVPPWGSLLEAERPRPASAREEPGCDDGDETPAITPPVQLVSRRITLEDARRPPVERFLVGSLFPFGKASVFYGPTGAGKSTFLSQLGFGVAGGGRDFLGMRMHDEEGGPVLVYSAEDTFEDWQRKAAAVLSACDVNMEHALERLHVVDKSEGEARLSELVQLHVNLGAESTTRRERRPSPERLALIAHAMQLQARLVIIETTSRLVDDEDNANLSALLSACGHVAAETGAAVIVSHHPTKNAAKDNDSSLESARGGGAFTANSRCAVSIFPAEAQHLAQLEEKGLHFAPRDVLLLEQQKGTSSVPRQEPVVLVRCSTPFGAVLKLPHAALADPAQAAMHAARRELEQRRREVQLAGLYDLVEQLRNGGPVSKRKLRDHGPSIGVTKHDMDDFVDGAIAAGVIGADRRDASGRILALGLGKRPAGRATPRDPREVDDDQSSD
jgi:hypothetical protein